MSTLPREIVIRNANISARLRRARDIVEGQLRAVDSPPTELLDEILGAIQETNEQLKAMAGHVELPF